MHEHHPRLQATRLRSLDGRQHMEQVAYDKKRTDYLEYFGFSVLRFWNNEIFSQLDLVLEQVRLSVKI